MAKRHELRFEGHLGADPELKFSQKGLEVCRFPVAVDASYKPKGSDEWVKKTIWFRVTCFGPTAALANDKFKKGNEIGVVASIDPDPKTGGPRLWQKKDGTWSASYEVIAWGFNTGEDGEELPARQIEDEVQPQGGQFGEEAPF